MFVRSLLVVAFAVAVVGCGGGDPCSRNSPCPNDTPSTQAERDSCRALLDANKSAACYGDYIGLANCQLDNIVCGGDGKFDQGLSATKATNNCTNQTANYTACCVKNASSTAC
jgi:hypothetical protein